MMRAEDLTVVMQGDIRPQTLAAIEAVRHLLPDAKLQLSTFAACDIEALRPLVDEVVLSEDPGAQVPFTFAGSADNNVNRQIMSTAAGLARVSSRYALKLRTDCVLQSTRFLQLAQMVQLADPERKRLLASSYFTRHPTGIACYAYHVSDWFLFGAAVTMRQFWAALPMSDADATYFERTPHCRASTLAASRFRARYTPEQHIAVQYAAHLGFKVPAYLNEVSPAITAGYQRFLARHFVIASPVELGFSLPKYADVGSSLYQRIDCVSFEDWLELFSANTNAANALALAQRLRPSARFRPVRILRSLLHPVRRPVSRLVLAKRRLLTLLGSGPSSVSVPAYRHPASLLVRK